MGQLKPGDRVDCRIKSNIIVGPYKKYDEVRTFEIVSCDSSGYYLYVPVYIILMDSIKADSYLCRTLNINLKFVDEQIVLIAESKICNIHAVLDGMTCVRCKEFYNMAQANQEDGSMICWQCRNYRYR